ncbi:hypothetical protein CBL_07362 [Carabus blaptoides fortunei]
MASKLPVQPPQAGSKWPNISLDNLYSIHHPVTSLVITSASAARDLDANQCTAINPIIDDRRISKNGTEKQMDINPELYIELQNERAIWPRGRSDLQHRAVNKTSLTAGVQHVEYMRAWNTVAYAQIFTSRDKQSFCETLVYLNVELETVEQDNIR